MPWVSDGTNTITLATVTVTAPIASLQTLGFYDQFGALITSAAAGAAITVKVVIKNTGGAGQVAATVDRADTGARIIDQSGTLNANDTATWTATFTMPSNTVTCTLTRWHWA